MKRLLVLVVVVLVFAGCNCQTPPAANPFVGPTTVPPPGTNSYNGLPNQYYPGQLQVAPPYNAVPQTAPGSGQPVAPGGSQNYAPPGGSFDYGGSTAPSFETPSPSRSTQHLSPTPRPVSEGPEETEVVGIQTIEIPRSALAATQPASKSKQPRLLDPPEDVIDLADLPEVSPSAAGGATRSGSSSAGFRLVSGTEASAEAGEVTPATGSSSDAGNDVQAATLTPQTFYGRAPDYGWLRGKLEYSQIDRLWKLRYIPVDGKTDEFGGSVVFADTAALAGLERGDFVEVRGQVGKQAPKNGFAPTYQVAQAERLGKATP